MEQMTFWGPQITDEEWEFIRLLRLCRELEEARIYAGIGLSDNRGNKYWNPKGLQYNYGVHIGSASNSGSTRTLQEIRSHIFRVCSRTAQHGNGEHGADWFRKHHGAWFRIEATHFPAS